MWYQQSVSKVAAAIKVRSSGVAVIASIGTYPLVAEGNPHNYIRVGLCWMCWSVVWSRPTCAAVPVLQIVDKLFELDPDGSLLAFADMMRKQIVMPAHLMDDGEHEGKTGRNLFAVSDCVQHISVRQLHRAWSVLHCPYEVGFVRSAQYMQPYCAYHHQTLRSQPAVLRCFSVVVMTLKTRLQSVHNLLMLHGSCIV